MYAGQKWYDFNAAQGVGAAKRNPRRKKRLPYHANRALRLPVMDDKGRKCAHALSRHEMLIGDGHYRDQTISYSLPCNVGHRATTKNPTHRDTLGRKWQ